MKSSTGKSNFKGAKVVKDFFKGKSKVEAPGTLTFCTFCYEAELTNMTGTARSYAEVAKSDSHSCSTSILAARQAKAAFVDDPFPSMSTAAMKSAQSVEPLSPLASGISSKTTPLYEQDALRIPMPSTTTKPSAKNASPKLNNTFTFVANASSTKPLAFAKSASSKSASPTVPSFEKIAETTMTSPTTGVEKAEDPWKEVKSTNSSKTKAAIHTAEVKFRDPSRKKSNKKKVSKVIKAPSLPSSSLVNAKAMGRKADSEEAEASKKVVSAAQLHKAWTKVVGKVEVEQNVRANDSADAVFTARDQGMSFSPQTLYSCNHFFSYLPMTGGQSDAPSVPKKKKRNQKSGAQRKKEARDLDLAEACVPPYLRFIDVQISKINIEARADASKHELSSDIWELKTMASNIDACKHSRDGLEKTLRATLTDFYLQGIELHVYDEEYALSFEYEAQKGLKLTNEDEKRVHGVFGYQAKAFRNACFNLAVHERVLKALASALKADKPREGCGVKAVVSSLKAPLFQAKSMPSASDFAIKVPPALRASGTGVSFGNQREFTMPTPSARGFNFNMPSTVQFSGSVVSPAIQKESTFSPFAFQGFMTAAADTSGPDDTFYDSEDTAEPASDASVTDHEFIEDTIEKKNEPCVDLIKYYGSLLPTNTVMVSRISQQRPSSTKEDTFASVEMSHTGLPLMIAVKLDAPSLPQPSLKVQPLKLEFQMHLPHKALNILALQGSYPIPIHLKLSAPFTEDVATPPPIVPNSVMVLWTPPPHVPCGPSSTHRPRTNKGPYRLNVQIGVSTLREFLTTLSNAYAHAYTRTPTRVPSSSRRG
jgi:hypothetical protein